MLIVTRRRPPEGGYDADVQAWINGRAAQSDPVGTAYADAVNQYVLDLKAISGHWATISQLYVFAGATTVAGLLVPIKSGPTMTQNNIVAGDIALRTGVLGNTTNKSLNTGYIGTDFSQNSAHCYCLVTAAPTGTNRALFGHSGISSGRTVMIWNTAAGLHTATGGTFSGTAVGGYGVSRSASSNYDRMVADAVTNVSGASGTSNVPSSQPLMVLARTNATGVIELWGNARILVWGCGTGNTIGDYTTPGNTLRTALNSIP